MVIFENIDIDIDIDKAIPKISISISISIWWFWKISISISISIRQFCKISRSIKYRIDSNLAYRTGLARHAKCIWSCGLDWIDLQSVNVSKALKNIFSIRKSWFEKSITAWSLPAVERKFNNQCSVFTRIHISPRPKTNPECILGIVKYGLKSFLKTL